MDLKNATPAEPHFSPSWLLTHPSFSFVQLAFMDIISTLEKVTRFTGFAGGKVIKAIHLTFRLQSSSLFADSTWPF